MVKNGSISIIRRYESQCRHLFLICLLTWFSHEKRQFDICPGVAFKEKWAFSTLHIYFYVENSMIRQQFAENNLQDAAQDAW